ncbi:unnamed protein product [Jaminaea pallidilutea]
MRTFTVCATLVFAALSLFALVAQAGPIPENLKRIVWNPPITAPTHKSVWTAGHKQKVTWDTAKLPKALRYASSELKLGYQLANGSGGENLHWTLADGFALKEGEVTFTLPKKLAARDDYIVVLMGDSGNASPKFSIKAD